MQLLFPSPTYPGLQEQLYDPTVFGQLAFGIEFILKNDSHYKWKVIDFISFKSPIKN